MSIRHLEEKAEEIANLYDIINKKDNHRKRDIEQYISGMIGDVGDLQKLIMAKYHYRHSGKEDIDKAIAHELSDILRSLLILSQKLNINLEEEFISNMNTLKIKLS